MDHQTFDGVMVFEGTDTNGTAIISDCGRYRYKLTRRLGDSPTSCLFIMLNPSTADAAQDDPTIRRCMGYARDWGCGELVVVNLFAFRATSPKDMMAADDPIGPENHHYVMAAADHVVRQNLGFEPDGKVICAWGTHGAHMQQGETVRGWLEADSISPMCLRATQQGHPSHPLYLPKNLRPIKYAQNLA